MNSIDWLVIKYVVIPFMLLIGYLLFYRRLTDMVQPIRLEMADLGEQILTRSISERRASQVRFYLDNAFSGYVLAGAVILFPVYVFITVGRVVFRKKIEDTHSSSDEKKLALLFTISAFAANPFCGLILFAQFALFGLVLFMGIIYFSPLTIAGESDTLFPSTREIRK